MTVSPFHPESTYDETLIFRRLMLLNLVNLAQMGNVIDPNSTCPAEPIETGYLLIPIKSL
jgi:hypothetical protein